MSEVKVSQSGPTLLLCGLYSPWDSPGQNTGVDSHSLLQGIFPTQESNPGLPQVSHRQILYHLSHWGNLKQDGRSLTLSLFDSPRSSEHHSFQEHLPCGSAGKESTCNVGDLGLIPGLGRFPGEGNGNPLQYSYLETPIDRGAWWATVHGEIGRAHV